MGNAEISTVTEIRELFLDLDEDAQEMMLELVREMVKKNEAL